MLSRCLEWVSPRYSIGDVYFAFFPPPLGLLSELYVGHWTHAALKRHERSARIIVRSESGFQVLRWVVMMSQTSQQRKLCSLLRRRRPGLSFQVVHQQEDCALVQLLEWPQCVCRCVSITVRYSCHSTMTQARRVNGKRLPTCVGTGRT